MRGDTVETLILATVPKMGGSVPLPQRTSVRSVAAYINHGRWVVNCPDCNGAELVDLSDLRFFCLNALCDRPDGGQWLSVVLPANRGEIESEILKRKMPNRNWLQVETVADLRAENAAEGIA